MERNEHDDRLGRCAMRQETTINHSNRKQPFDKNQSDITINNCHYHPCKQARNSLERALTMGKVDEQQMLSFLLPTE
eukprot:scaffold60368_cov26-Attheya_sp.AAC.1